MPAQVFMVQVAVKTDIRSRTNGPLARKFGHLQTRTAVTWADDQLLRLEPRVPWENPVSRVRFPSQNGKNAPTLPLTCSSCPTRATN